MIGYFSCSITGGVRLQPTIRFQLLADYNCTEWLLKDKRLEIGNEMEVIFCSDTDCDKSFLTGFEESYLYCKVAMERSIV